MLAFSQHRSENTYVPNVARKQAPLPPPWSVRGKLRAFVQNTLLSAKDSIYNLYLITIDDTPTFVVPNTVFGMASALTSGLLVCTSESRHSILGQLNFPSLLYAIFRTIMFNWTNLLVFDMANQRQAGKEDMLNKAWRPIPSGRMTSTGMRRCMIVAIPLVLGYNHCFLHTSVESCLLIILVWLYNDLGGGDDHWVLRNLLIACGFGVYNIGSLKVAASSLALTGPAALATSVSTTRVLEASQLMESPVSGMGWTWLLIVSGVIFTTMHVQDLKDVAGDRARGRRSAPIILGQRVAAWTVAVPVVWWSGMCVYFWAASLSVALAVCSLGAVVAWRCVNLCGQPSADRRTWQLWCAWTALLYMVPPLSTQNKL